MYPVPWSPFFVLSSKNGNKSYRETPLRTKDSGIETRDVQIFRNRSFLRVRTVPCLVLKVT